MTRQLREDAINLLATPTWRDNARYMQWVYHGNRDPRWPALVAVHERLAADAAKLAAVTAERDRLAVLVLEGVATFTTGEGEERVGGTTYAPLLQAVHLARSMTGDAR